MEVEAEAEVLAEVLGWGVANRDSAVVDLFDTGFLGGLFCGGGGGAAGSAGGGLLLEERLWRSHTGVDNGVGGSVRVIHNIRSSSTVRLYDHCSKALT